LAATPVDIHKDIIESCLGGSKKAQFELYQLYSKAMFNICYRMMNNREEAEDMLQESFVDAFRRLGSFRFESTFGAWLKRITVNHCINAIKKKRANLVFFEDMHRFDGSDDENDEKGKDEYLKLSVQRVYDAMEQLPEGGRIVFSLYMLEGYDHAEIAKILKITESTSKSQYMRAKRKIKDILTDIN
jgi:RNA polymerase sigma-70 factor (ECF subfamily)